MKTFDTLLFLHYGRTGGTSIGYDKRHRIGKIIEKEKICPMSIYNSDSIISKQYEYVGNHKYYGIHERCEGTYRYFTVLRDPLRREISHYNRIMSIKGSFYNMYKEHMSTIEEFIRWLAFDLSGNPYIRSLNYNIHQEDGIHKNCTTEKCLGSFKNHYNKESNRVFTERHYNEALRVIKKDFIFVGFTENLENTFRRLNILFDKPVDYLLNVRVNRTYKDNNINISNEVIAKFKETYKWDYKLYYEMMDKFPLNELNFINMHEDN